MIASVVPPDLHWALVLLLSVLTFTLFGWAWLIVQAAYVRRIDNESKSVLLAVFSLACAFLGWFTTVVSRTWDGEPTPWAGVFLFVGFILLLGAIFQIRSDLEDYFNVVEPINLQVSGVLTFFCGILYLQYHFSRIAQWKKTGVLAPQGA